MHILVNTPQEAQYYQQLVHARFGGSRQATNSPSNMPGQFWLPNLDLNILMDLYSANHGNSSLAYMQPGTNQLVTGTIATCLRDYGRI